MTGISVFALVILAGGPAVKEGGAPLRASCTSDAEIVAQLPGDTALTVRSSISGDLGTCYRVVAGDKTGYLLAAEMTGTENYDRARARATDRGMPIEIRSEIGRLQQEIASTASSRAGSSNAMTSSVAGALRLLDSGQPREALKVLEDNINRGAGRDPFILAAAGLAAYQSDQVRVAVNYWGESLQLRPNTSVESLYRKAQRELTADNSRSRVQGGRFAIRYDQAELPEPQAQALLAASEQEFTRIDAALSCGIQEQMTIILQGREAYRASSGAAEWSAAQYDGRIRVALPSSGITAQVRQSVAHEVVHACLAANGEFPAWFHEGMAQRWSGQTLSGSERNRITSKLRDRSLPYLNNLSTSFARMSAEHAALAYDLSLAAVETLYQSFGDQYVRNLLRNPNLIPQVANQVSTQLASR